MAAHVEERVNRARSIARDDDAVVGERAREVVAGVRDLIDASGANPPVEIKALELAAVEIGIRVESARKRRMHVDRIIQPAPTLCRALGRWDLTAIGINQVIGGAIFLMPSQVAAEICGWSPIAFVLMGLASLSVALCFAEVGSRFERTGGPYLYTRAAFGRFVAFEVGWMQWFTRASSQASVMAGIAVALGYYWPAITADWPRAVLLIGVTVALTWVNVVGIRQSAWVVNALTIGKLLPLAFFILAGLRFV